MMERLLTKMDANQKRLEAKTKANHENMADLKTQIGCLTSRIDVNQENEEAVQREMKASQEKAEVAIRSIRSELEKTIGWKTSWHT
jgi:N-methylhydantoinase B/oxoprolinase/acetone carboxylase alpha subunit